MEKIATFYFWNVILVAQEFCPDLFFQCFKGLDLIDREPNELRMEVHDILQETGIKTIPMEKTCKKAK